MTEQHFEPLEYERKINTPVFKRKNHIERVICESISVHSIYTKSLAHYVANMLGPKFNDNKEQKETEEEE